ncbi:MAG: hypothetical protein ACO3QO_05535 [Candidatus Kapaibacteriota bacterium]
MAIARRILLAVLVMVGSVSVPSCLLVKAPAPKPVATEQAPLSPVPEITMGDDIVRSAQGDMIASLPKDWMFLDVHDDVSDDLLAVAVNPEYTLSVVFSVLPQASTTSEAYETEGLLGLARMAYQKHQRKAAGRVSLKESYSVTTLGTRMFGQYAFSNGATTTRCAVFRSMLGNFYQCAVVPLTITSRDIPSEREQQAVYSSILATIQY